MSEQLGEAVLVLRTDDTGLDRGISGAESKARSLDGTFKQSAAGVSDSFGTMTVSAKHFDASVGNSRAGMMEFQHVVRGMSDQLAAGTPITQALGQHMAMLGEAVTLSGGAFGKVGAFLGGPWGIALTLATTAVVALIGRHTQEGDTLEGLMAKLQQHADKTRLSEEADRAWSETLDGLIDRQRKLNDELNKRLTTQSATDNHQLDQATTDRSTLTADAAAAWKKLLDLQAQLAATKAAPLIGATPEDLAAAAVARAAEVSRLQSAIDAAQVQVGKINTAIDQAQGRITKGQIVIGQKIGEAMGDLTSQAKQWSDHYLSALTGIEVANNGKLAPSTATITSGFDSLKTSIDKAASAGVDFAAKGNNFIAQARELGLELQAGKIQPLQYAEAMKKLADQLDAVVKAAKEAAKIDPVKQFKQSVIGAEGTGPNKLGSSAAGFGQFMPKTWLSYFDKLFPDKADLSEAAKLAYRNVRGVAEAVIDKATDDYAAVLKAAGEKVTAANLYTVHLLGAPDARKLFAASPNAPTSSVLSKDVLAGNPMLKGTVAQAEAAIAKRIGDSSAAVSAGSAALAQGIQQEKDREARYTQQSDELDNQVIEARQALAQSSKDIADFATKAVQAAHKKTDDAIASAEADGKLLPEEAKALRDINDERLKYKQQLIDRRLREAEFAAQTEGLQRTRDLESGSHEAQAELLHSQEALAKTAGQRRVIEQKLIDLQFAEERLKDQYVIDWAERVKANKDATDKEKADAALAGQIAKMHLATLNQRQGNATTANNQQNAGPLASYFASIPQGAAEINDALQNIAKDGLAAFNNGLVDAIMNSKSLGEMFHNIASQILSDLLKLALQEAELALFKMVMSTASASVGGARASGGPVIGGTPYLVGEKGPEIFMPSNSGQIISNDNIPHGGSGQHVSVTNYNDFRGADSSAVAAIQQRQDQFERELPGRVVETMQDARARFVWKN